jgi:hypothetical protein
MMYKVTTNFSYWFENTYICYQGWYQWTNTTNNFIFCLKNMSYVFPGGALCPLPSIVVPVVNNTSNNTFNSVIYDNITSVIDLSLTVMGKILTFSNLNFIPKTIKLIFLFIDDIWYYKFHRTEYP